MTQVLRGIGTTGDFVLKNQELATSEGFGHVAKRWYDQTMSYEQGRQALEADRAQTEDILATVKEMTPRVSNRGDFCMYHYTSGREFRPTEHAVGQMGSKAGCGQWFPLRLLENPENAKGVQLFSRDGGDADTLAQVIRNGFRRLDENKKFLWRTRKDGTLRAMLTEQYAAIDNRWYIDTMSKLIPGGRLSHWRGDADTIWGNVLIPDTIRAESDSDYGGMLSVGNSEIGERAYYSCPSVFRAICMNGCVWDKTAGKSLEVIHRGEINLERLFERTRENLEIQIPLLNTGIDRLLATRAMTWGTGSMLPLFAQLAIDFKLSKKQASGVVEAYSQEVLGTPDYARTLFSVVNSVTRAGQQLTNAAWFKFDQIGGKLSSFDENDWSSFTRKARSLKEKEIDSIFALAM